MIYIFDLDGTLVDTNELHADSFVQAFGEVEGKKVSKERIKELVGFTARDIIRTIGAKNPEAVLQRKNEIFLKRVEEVKEIPGATKLLKELKSRGHKLCIATSASRSTLEAMLKKFGWPVDKTATADDVLRGKPAPDLLLKVLEGSEGPALFVGDSEYDRQAAEAAGIPVLILGKELKKLEDLLQINL